ncbi:MAG TPA: uroporphyrinogen decarboxylase family protein [Ktedonobacteraceae bacterium]|nr:uroporphyrinogen decarboxylase family protein [Ktedonobacteraceae bacterium]
MTTSSQGMSASERVHAAIQGQPVDRVPLVFWHHFKPEGSGQRLAEMTLDFFIGKFRLDIVKIMPDLPYPAPQQPVTQAVQWRDLPRLSVANTESFQQQLVCIRTIREKLGNDYPLILTLFSPLTMLMRFVGKPTAEQMLRSDPDSCEVGMKTIAANLRDLMKAAIDTGVSGIFFSCMGATNVNLTREEYKQYGRPYDLQALEGAQDGWLNVVHVHADPNQAGDELYFDIFTDYPVSVMSWSDKLTGPSLSEAFTMTDKGLMAGLAERGPLTQGPEDALADEMRAAIAQTNGRRLILANGCSVPDDTPEIWLHAARRLVDTIVINR